MRPAGADKGDQARVMTPAEAIRLGASYLVIGRPIIKALDRLLAVKTIVGEMEAASK